MRNKLKRAFDAIQTEEQLKQNTLNRIKDKTKSSRPYQFRRIAAIACTVLLISFAGLSYNQYYTASAYIDLDVNPSIELTMNRFGRIIDEYSYNEDGNVILSSIKLKHKSYNDALELLIAEIEEQGYIMDEGLLSATLQSNGNKAEEWLSGIQYTIDNSLSSHHSMIEKDIFAVDAETKELAHEHNVSPAKYTAILELQEVDSTASVEGCRDHSVDDIKEQIENHHQQSDGVQNECEEDHIGDNMHNAEHGRYKH